MRSTAAAPYRFATAKTHGDAVMTEFTRGFICGLREKGEPVSIIARQLDLPETTVGAVIAAVKTKKSTAQAAVHVDSPVSTSQVINGLEELRVAMVAKEAACVAMEKLKRRAFRNNSCDALFDGLLAFLCPDGSPTTPQDVVALRQDRILDAVAKQLLECDKLLSLPCWIAYLPEGVTSVPKTVAALLKRTSTLDCDSLSPFFVESLVSSLVRYASTAEETAWVAFVVSLGRGHLPPHRFTHDATDSQRTAGVQDMASQLLVLASKATTRRSAKWTAAAFRAIVGEGNHSELVAKHFATPDVRDALLRLAFTKRATRVRAPDVVEEVCGALHHLMATREGRRCMRCAQVRDAVIAMANAASITPEAAAQVMHVIAKMAVSDLSDEEEKKYQYNRRYGFSSDYVAAPALREYFTPALCDALLGLAWRSIEAPNWFEAAASSLSTVMEGSERNSVAKHFETVAVRDMLVDLLGHAHRHGNLHGSRYISERLCRLPFEILRLPLAATATVRDALLVVSEDNVCRGSLMSAFGSVSIHGAKSQTLFGTVEVRNALIRVAPHSSKTAAFILKLVQNHAENQALFRCVALRDAFVAMEYWSDDVVDVMICLLEGCDDTTTMLFRTAAIRDAIVAWYSRGDRSTASSLRLLTLLTLLTVHDVTNPSLFATPGVHGLLMQLAATKCYERAAAGVLSKLRHSVEVMFDDINGRVTLVGSDVGGYVLDGVTMAAPMGVARSAMRLEEVSLGGLERLAGSDGEFLSGATSLRSVAALDALEGWRRVGDGFLRGCASLHRLCL